MTNKIILVLCSLVFTISIQAQKKEGFAGLKEALLTNKVYAPGKTYNYNVVKTNAEGDTLSKELVKMHILDKSIRPNMVEGTIFFVWEYTGKKDYEESLSPISKAITQRAWISVDTSTLHLNDEEIYLHPMRDNQYYQVEVSPHPTVKLYSKDNKSYLSKIVVLGGFGKYNMKQFTSYFEIVGRKKFQLNKEELDCYEIVSETNVEKFSLNTVKSNKTEDTLNEEPILNKAMFLLNENNGFVRMNYEFKDGEKLFIEMID